MEDDAAKITSAPLPVPPPIPPAKPRRSRSSKRSWLPRPAYVAIFFAVTLAVSWGAFTIVSRQSHIEDDSELADLEGFELDAPSVNSAAQAERQSDSDSKPRTVDGRIGQSNIDRTDSAFQFELPGSVSLPSFPVIPGVQTATFERVPPFASSEEPVVGVWLMGTIEADDTPSAVVPPTRLARNPLDGPAIR